MGLACGSERGYESSLTEPRSGGKNRSYMLKNKLCQCRRNRCERVATKKQSVGLYAVDSLEQVSVNKKGGEGVGTRGSWLDPGERMPAAVLFRGDCSNPGSVMVARTSGWLKNRRGKGVRNIWNRTSVSLGCLMGLRRMFQKSLEVCGAREDGHCWSRLRIGRLTRLGVEFDFCFRCSGKISSWSTPETFEDRVNTAQETYSSQNFPESLV